MEEFSGGLENLMLGDAQEISQENQEKIAARVKAVQIKLTKLKKDESKNQSFDRSLAQIIKKLGYEDLAFISQLIDMDVPSIFILSLVSFYVPDAHKICSKTFDPFIAQHADFSDSEAPEKIQQKIELWWTYLLAANHTTKDKISILNQTHPSLHPTLENFIQKMYAFSGIKKPFPQVLQRHAFYIHLLFQEK